MNDRTSFPTLSLAFFVAIWLGTLSLSACNDSGSSENDQTDGDTVQTCDSDLDCTRGVCDLATHTCVEDPYACVRDSDCPDGFSCNLTVGRCQEGISCGALQVEQNGSCVDVDCVSDADCADTLQICDVLTNTCRDPACDPPCNELQRCIPGNICQDLEIQCVTDENCPGNKRCDRSINDGTCVAVVCDKDQDCHDDYYCNLTTQACVEPCTRDNQCEGILICNLETNRCEDPTVTCEDDYTCAAVLPTWVCQEGVCETGNTCRSGVDCSENRKCGDNGTCVFGGCFVQEDCDSPKLCDTAIHKCVIASPDGAYCVVENPSVNPCLSHSRCLEGKCHPLCEPLNPECAEGEVCAFYLEPGMSGYGSACMEPKGGLGVGSDCSEEANLCEIDIICFAGSCRQICDPDGPSSQCGEGYSGCWLVDDYGVGVCGDPPCNQTTNPCEEGQGCVNGVCGACVEDANCRSGTICDRGVCKQSCVYAGCLEGLCNTRTGALRRPLFPRLHGRYLLPLRKLRTQRLQPCLRISLELCERLLLACGLPQFLAPMPRSPPSGSATPPRVFASNRNARTATRDCVAAKPPATNAPTGVTPAPPPYRTEPVPENQYCDSGSCTDIPLFQRDGALRGPPPRMFPTNLAATATSAARPSPGPEGICCHACDWTGGCAY